VIVTSRHEKRQKKGQQQQQQQQQQQRKGNTPELDDAGKGNPRRLGSKRGMRLASAITAVLSLSLSLSLSEPQAIRSLFFLLKHNGRPDVTSNWHRQVKLFAEDWQVFHLHSTGFEPRSFFRGPRMGYTSEPSPLESKFDR
jgi:hypothetical protein